MDDEAAAEGEAAERTESAEVTVGGAWGGDPALRRAVLEHLAGHLAAGRLGTVLARETTLRPYELQGLGPIAVALDLPEPVLRVGYVLWQGLHDIGSARQTVEHAREIYQAIAVGADLSAFANEFAAWVLADPEHGFVNVLPPSLAERAQDDADRLLLGLPLETEPFAADPTGYLPMGAARRVCAKP